MALAPICPKCGGNGHDGHTFAASEWTAADAERHGFDPDRTSAGVLRCQGCGHWFPLLHWRTEQPTGFVWALHDEDGTPHRPPEESPWFAAAVKAARGRAL